MASPCGLGIVTAWWFQGSQFLKWGPGFQEQVPSEQEKSCMAFFCLVFFPFNNLMEIQFTYHTIFPFKMYLSVVSMYSEFFNYHYSQLQNILIAPQKKLHISMFPQPQATTSLLSVSIQICLFWTFHGMESHVKITNGITQQVAFCD